MRGNGAADGESARRFLYEAMPEGPQQGTGGGTTKVGKTGEAPEALEYIQIFVGIRMKCSSTITTHFIGCARLNRPKYHNLMHLPLNIYGVTMNTAPTKTAHEARRKKSFVKVFDIFILL